MICAVWSIIFVSKYAIGKVQESQNILKLNEINQFLVYADVNLLDKLHLLSGNHKSFTSR
jgi:hypothetical protein